MLKICILIKLFLNQSLYKDIKPHLRCTFFLHINLGFSEIKCFFLSIPLNYIPGAKELSTEFPENRNNQIIKENWFSSLQEIQKSSNAQLPKPKSYWTLRTTRKLDLEFYCLPLSWNIYIKKLTSYLNFFVYSTKTEIVSLADRTVPSLLRKWGNWRKSHTHKSFKKGVAENKIKQACNGRLSRELIRTIRKMEDKYVELIKT